MNCLHPLSHWENAQVFAPTPAFSLAVVITHILGKDLRESQRDSATKPRVARNELPSYPGSIASGRANPNGVESVGGKRGRNPVAVGVETRFAPFPRVAPPLFLGTALNTAVQHCELLGCIIVVNGCRKERSRNPRLEGAIPSGLVPGTTLQRARMRICERHYC